MNNNQETIIINNTELISNQVSQLCKQRRDDLTKDTPPSYVITDCPNPDVKILGIRQIVTDEIINKFSSVKGIRRATKYSSTSGFEIMLIKGIAFTWKELIPEIEKVCNEISIPNPDVFTPSNKPTKTITWNIDRKLSSVGGAGWWEGFLSGINALIINTGTCDEGVTVNHNEFAINSPEELIITMYCEGSNLEEFYNYINQQIEKHSISIEEFDALKIDRAETLNSIN